ncbi:MAG: tRNA-dihydrouridine synthase family protein [Bacteroidaceae bacterium]|nr:tRNA-dihydrouridine synthase family protein [Bacteroidaceae bacterium]
MKIYSAPLQGFTEAIWRNVHNEVFGCIDGYCTPFLRYEHGEIRNKDVRDVEHKNNTVHNLVPQIIAATPEEMRPLMELIANEGYDRIDINMGCSFPLQVRRKHGAGLLPHPEMVAALLKATAGYPNFRFSVKMRLGWESKEEWKALIPILNDTPLTHITMHPRLGIEQYKTPADAEAFAEFLDASKHPVIYNGDINTLGDIQRVEAQFPTLKGVMIGRGLLANPALGIEYREGEEVTDSELCRLVQAMHDKMFALLSPRLQGNTQFLTKMKPYWEYLLPTLPKRLRKPILKATTIDKYQAAVATALRGDWE